MHMGNQIPKRDIILKKGDLSIYFRFEFCLKNCKIYYAIKKILIEMSNLIANLST